MAQDYWSQFEEEAKPVNTATGGDYWSQYQEQPKAAVPKADARPLIDRVLESGASKTIQSIFPGRSLGEAIGTQFGASITSIKEGLGYLPKGTSKAYDESLSPKQAAGVAGDVAQAALLPVSAGASAGAKFLPALAKSAGLGYASDVASGLSGQRGEDRTGFGALKPGVGTAIGAGIPILGKGISKASGMARRSREAKILEELVPVENAKNIKEARTVGALKDVKAFSPGVFDASKMPHLKEQASAVSEVAKSLGKKPEDIIKSGVGKSSGNLTRVDQAISDYSDVIMKPKYSGIKSNFNFADTISRFDTISRDKNPVFKEIMQDALDDMAKTLRKSGASPDVDINTMWSLRKSIDRSFEKKYGDKLFTDPLRAEGAAAAREFRDEFTNYIKDLIRHPKQQAELTRAYEIHNAALAKGIDTPLEAVKKQMGIVDDKSNLKALAEWDTDMSRLKNLYDIGDTLLEKTNTLKNQNIFSALAKKHPKKSALGGLIGSSIIGGGIYGAVSK